MSVLRGDCVEVMAGMDPDSVDAIVTDPPYGLEFMGKEWDRLDGTLTKPGIGERHTAWPSFGDDFAGYNPTCETCGGRARGKRKCVCAEPAWKVRGQSLRDLATPKAGNLGGFATGDKPSFERVLKHLPQMQAWHQAWAAAALRVAKPGAYLLAFGGTRTVHRMTTALEDAGWVIRDMLVWAYAQGFPKSKASLKPAWEPIVLARKPGPLRDLNIDAARIGFTSDADEAESKGKNQHTRYANPGSGRDSYSGNMPPRTDYDAPGRWPSNVILTDPIFDGGWDGVVGGGETGPGAFPGEYRRQDRTQYRIGSTGEARNTDSGTYSRFFLVPKAPTRERVLSDGRRSPHPTQKPEALIRHLVRLVTPDGGLVLDPFLGSGTLGVVCDGLGIRWAGIEREPEYADWAEDRVRDGRPLWDDVA